MNPASGVANHQVCFAAPHHIDQAVDVAVRAAGVFGYSAAVCEATGPEVTPPRGGPVLCVLGSGIGREKGLLGFRLYQQSKSIYLDLEGGLT